jgi:hypothetical protein
MKEVGRSITAWTFNERIILYFFSSVAHVPGAKTSEPIAKKWFFLNFKLIKSLVV